MKNLKHRKLKEVKAKKVGLTPTEKREVEDTVVVSFDKYRDKLRGPQGEQGEKGEAGAQGERGNDGLAGIPGKAGAKGERGAKGAKGIAGADGRRGRIGQTGTKGDVGPRGPAGPKGDKGDVPEHQWKDTRLRFKKPDGSWGNYVQLQGMVGGRGRAGHEGGGASVKEIWDSITLSGTDLVFGRTGSLGEDVTVDLSALAGGAVDVNNAQRIDEVGDVMYIGDAVPGTAESAAAWRIKRLTFIPSGSDTDVDTEWANGSDTRDRVWDDRLTETYT